MFNLLKLLNSCKELVSNESYGVHNLKLHFFRSYATNISGLGKGKKVAKGAVTLEKRVIPVETDPQKLVNYCCGSNIYKEGSDVKLKPDDEYPDWLWELNIGKPLTLDEMDPNTIQYWRKVRKIGMKRNNRLRSLRKF